MIPVPKQDEPADFAASVRQPGLQCLALPPHKATKNYWRHCHDALYAAYGGYCAYLAVRIPRSPQCGVAGGSSVDHSLSHERPA